MSNTFISSKIYISSDTVYTTWGHMQCLQPACMFLVLEVDVIPILLDHVTLFSVFHAADEEHYPLKNPSYLTRNMLQQTHVISHRNSSFGCNVSPVFSLPSRHLHPWLSSVRDGLSWTSERTLKTFQTSAVITGTSRWTFTIQKINRFIFSFTSSVCLNGKAENGSLSRRTS